MFGWEIVAEGDQIKAMPDPGRGFRYSGTAVIGLFARIATSLDDSSVTPAAALLNCLPMCLALQLHDRHVWHGHLIVCLCC